MAVGDLVKKLLGSLRPVNAPPARYAYGKVPGAGDFLRAGARDDATNAFEAWLAKAMATADSMRGAEFRAAYDGEQTWLLQARFGAARGGRILAGAMRTSRDSVGRRHPLVLGALLPPDGHFAAPELVPLAIAETQRDALTVLDRVGGVATNKELAARLEDLRLPTPQVFDEARTSWNALLTHSATSFFHRRFPSAEHLSWAIHTFREAVTPSGSHEGSRARPGPRASLLLAVPCGGAVSETAAVAARLVRLWGHVDASDPILILSPAGAARSGAASRGLYFACGSEPPLTTLVDVVGGGAATDTLCDLRAAPRSTQGYRTVLAPGWSALLADPGTTLAQAISALRD